MNRAALAPLVAVSILPLACDATDMVHEPEWTLSRMLDQPRVDPYAPSSFFDDGRGMRRPVRGTVARSATLGPRALLEGMEDGVYVSTIPIPVTRQLLEEGREHFDVICATCHGVLGDGKSPVATKMQLRRPPSLTAPDIASFPPGRVYRVVTVGYGLMPAVDYQLDVHQRWATVSYLTALQRSQSAAIGELSPADRAKVEGAAR